MEKKRQLLLHKNREVKELFREQNIEDDLTEVLDNIENDDDIEIALEEAFESLDIDETLLEEETTKPEDPYGSLIEIS